jgi:hypothetical protein
LSLDEGNKVAALIVQDRDYRAPEVLRYESLLLELLVHAYGLKDTFIIKSFVWSLLEPENYLLNHPKQLCQLAKIDEETLHKAIKLSNVKAKARYYREYVDNYLIAFKDWESLKLSDGRKVSDLLAAPVILEEELPKLEQYLYSIELYAFSLFSIITGTNLHLMQ